MSEYNDIQGLDDTMPDWNNDTPEWVKEAEELCRSGENDVPESTEKHLFSVCFKCRSSILFCLVPQFADHRRPQAARGSVSESRSGHTV